MDSGLAWFWGIVLFLFFFIFLPSLRIIGPTEIGLVTKRFSRRKLPEDDPVAFDGEAGYQADLLMPGWRWKFWVVYAVEKFPWVQVPAGEIGVVVAQVGEPLAIGAKSGVYKPEFGNFSDLKTFVGKGGQKGVQRPVLPPGTLLPVHPVGFLVITKRKVYGVPVDPEIRKMASRGELACSSWNVAPGQPLTPDQLNVVRIEPVKPEDLTPEQLALARRGQTRGAESPPVVDMVGIVTAFEGPPLPEGDIAGRLGRFEDVEALEKEGRVDQDVVEAVFKSKNHYHNNYQDFQAFLDQGGRIGLQHDPLLYGAYTLNPFLVSVELVPMLVVEQGEVAVVKSYLGLLSRDVSGIEFKFGSLVRPGHRGIWQEPLRTGKYPINPRCYEAVIVPTYILTLNWAEATSLAHQLDKDLRPIVAKSREGFIFTVDLQVQIHVADTKAPRVISIVGSMQNLVSEVLQAAVGNHFRDKLQSMQAVQFIETRQQVQEEAFQHISAKLDQYMVETKGVYIQDVKLPEQLVKVLTDREIARQEIETYQRQKEAQDQRILTEQARGTADMQADLAKSKVGIDIKSNNATARKAEADGEATYIRETGAAKGAEVEAVGMARAKAYEAQVAALGQAPTALVNVANVLAEKNIKVVPDILVAGGSGLEGAAASLMKYLQGLAAKPAPEAHGKEK